MTRNADLLAPTDTFLRRHLGPSEEDIEEMLRALGLDSLDALTEAAVPKSILHDGPLALPAAKGESELLKELKAIASRNEIWRSWIGMGYAGTIVPPVIQRNVLENPGWYTQYTPYQAEIAQGRLEALLNYQTMVCEMTGMPIANASLLDEATAAAEAMTMCFRVNRKNKSQAFFVDELCHPQTIEVVKTRAEPLGIEVVVGDADAFDFVKTPVQGALVQYPDTRGIARDFEAFAKAAHEANALVVVATDLLALALLKPPGEWGADMVCGNSQRFGVPFGYGGPHAAFFATRDDYKRQMPGRIVGVSRDSHGMPALRLALQTREQHIRRDKATSNICTAQVLLAIMAGMYATYHGPGGIRAIAGRVHALAKTLAHGLAKGGYRVAGGAYFDTLKIEVDDEQREAVLAKCREQRINLRVHDDGALGITLDEPTTAADLDDLFACFGVDARAEDVVGRIDPEVDAAFRRTSAFLQHEAFTKYHAEHEFLRYVHRLQSRDLSLTTSMIPLGSCTMKLNATSEMLPVTWPEFAHIHPFAPAEQTQGYRTLITQLEEMLQEITGFHAVSLQPNSGAQGEYAGMLVIRAYHKSRGDDHRDVCLIPMSAHGTNPASSVMAGLKVVPVKCDDHGNIDVDDLKAKAEKHAERLAAIMVTYPSTHGVFESRIREICDVVHEHGGQVYLDGANLNAQCGLCQPAEYGADVCHMNLHKTFCIPHGGGGPGMGPIGVADHLAPFLPGHPVVETGGEQAIGPVSAAPWGSPSILPISWVYIRLVGAEGLKRATQVAVLNANYMRKRLEDDGVKILYTGETGWVAHEFIADMNPYKKSADVEVMDIAKRLMDYGFHAPTVSFPVAGTLMIEPTESESKEELDRLCDALVAIHGEIERIEGGEWDRENNPLKNAPHTSHAIVKDEWNHPYSREVAAFPGEWNRVHKFWPPVGRIDDVYGDKHLICSCDGMENWADEA